MTAFEGGAAKQGSLLWSATKEVVLYLVQYTVGPLFMETTSTIQLPFLLNRRSFSTT